MADGWVAGWRADRLSALESVFGLPPSLPYLTQSFGLNASDYSQIFVFGSNLPYKL